MKHIPVEPKARSVTKYRLISDMKFKECPEEKICSKCHILRPIDEFYRSAPAPDGHRNVCKICYGKITSEIRLKRLNGIEIHEQIKVVYELHHSDGVEKSEDFNVVQEKSSYLQLPFFIYKIIPSRANFLIKTNIILTYKEIEKVMFDINRGLTQIEVANKNRISQTTLAKIIRAYKKER